MGIMAVEASFCHGGVLEFNLRQGVTHLFVAFQAKLITGFQQIILIIRSMGIVAFYAVPFRKHLVHTAVGRMGHLGMARVADFIGIGSEQFAMG